MFEQSLFETSSTEHSTYNPNTYSPIESTGLNKIVSFGYGQNQIQSLPISRYALKISLMGLNEMGSVLAIALAALGHKVLAVDYDQRKINAINQSRVCTQDIKLQPLLKAVRRLNNLVATNDLYHTVLNSDLSILCADKGMLENNTAYPTKLAEACQQFSASLQRKPTFHTLMICRHSNQQLDHKQIAKYIENQSGKKLGVEFGLCIVPIELGQEHALTDFYSKPAIRRIASSDKTSANLAEKLFDGFNIKIRHTSLT